MQHFSATGGEDASDGVTLDAARREGIPNKGIAHESTGSSITRITPATLGAPDPPGDAAAPAGPPARTDEPGFRIGSAEPTTELGFSEVLACSFEPTKRFVVETRGWFVYDSIRWQPDHLAVVQDDTKTLAKEVHATARRRVKGAAGRSRLRNRLLSRAFMRSALALVESDPRVARRLTAFDADPALLNVVNGTLDLRTGELRNHRPEDLLTQAVLTEFAVDALAPTWDAFLLQSLGNDPSLVGYVRRAVGLTLASDMSTPALFLLHGPTASGKSTFLEVLLNALGDYAIATNAQEVLLRRRSERATEPHLAKLRAARFVVASETSADASLDEAKVKSLTGGDTISVRTLFERPIEFRPRFHIWLALNQLPRIHEVDDAIYRRIKVLPFPFSVAPENRDPGLRDRLSQELPGILAWVVRGAIEAKAVGLGGHPSVDQAIASYRTDMDVVGSFLQEAYVLDRDGSEWSADLYDAYGVWCAQSGEERMSQRRLAPLLRERGLASRRSTGGRSIWSGLRRKGGAGQIAA